MQIFQQKTHEHRHKNHEMWLYLSRLNASTLREKKKKNEKNLFLSEKKMNHILRTGSVVGCF
jgi:hypothetical protein